MKTRAHILPALTRLLCSLMLLLCALLLAAGLLLGTLGALPHKSYLLALLLALPVAAALLWLRGREGERPSLFARLGPGRTAATLTVLCLVVDLAGGLLLRLTPEVDARTYWESALALSQGQSVPNPVYLALFPHILGYARALGLFLRLFGRSIPAAVALNALVTAGICLLLYWICLRRRDLDSAAFAALLWISCPSKLLYCAGIYADSWYTLFLLAFVALCLWAEAGESLPRSALAGALAGLALHLVQSSRPVAAIGLIALGIWICLLRGERAREGRGWLRWGAFTALALAVYITLGALWQGYETRQLGEAPASVPGYSICVGFNEQSGGSYSEEDMQRLLELRAELGSADAAQRQMLEEAKPRIQSAALGRLLPAKLRTLLGNDEGGAFYARAALSERAYSLLAVISNIWWYAVLLLALCGLVRLGRQGERSALLLLPLYIVGLILAQMLVEVAGRYHYSIVPMLTVLAACADGAGIRKLIRR